MQKLPDRTLLVKYMQSQFPEIAARLSVEQNLIFWGMRSPLALAPVQSQEGGACAIAIFLDG